MSWKYEVKTQLAAVLARRPDAPVRIDESDDDRRALLRQAMTTGARLFRFARAELCQANVPMQYEFRNGSLRLSFEGRPFFVELEQMTNGLAIKVQREFGIVEILQAKDGVVVDRNQGCVGAIDGYFTCLVVELVRTGCGVSK